MTEEQARKTAKKQLGFYYHLAIYLTVNIVLILWQLYNNNRFGRMQYISLETPFFWGIGLTFHGLSTFFSSNLEDKLTQNILNKKD